jgi:diguanylate cyclase (GGDEF)-like protein
VRGLPDEETQDGVSPLADVEKLVIEGRYGRADLALRRLEALIPSLAATADTNTLLLALYGRALLLRQEGATTQNALAACDVLERAAHEREAELWVATACATRARFRVDSGDIGGATADLARADAEASTGDLTSDTGYRLLDALALVYAGLRLHDRADEVRGRIEHSIKDRRVLDQGQHWSTWSGELAARAMEPLAGGAPDPEHELMGRAIEIAAKLDGLPENQVPSTLRRGARGVRALSAAYRGRPSEALRLLGPDAFGTVGDLPLVERQIVSLAAMRAHALVGSLATARSLDDAATAPPATLPNLILEVCRTRERLWLETYAGGDVIPVLHRMTELLVRLGWRGMDLVADTARQALEHQALRTESRTDALTGVGNRRALDEELRQLLRFGPLPLALILVDIDHFKGVNDVYTHVVGDEVLRRVAASLSLQLRTDDQLLRYGGDEFVVLLPGTGDEEADAVADRMRAAVSDRPWSELADGLQVSITTGVAAVWSLSGRRPDADAEKLFRRADERLLEGKRNRPEVSRSHSRPALPVAPTPPASPAPSEPGSVPSAEITVMFGAETDGFDRTGIADVRIADASQLSAIPPETAVPEDDSLTIVTSGLPVTRRPADGKQSGTGPASAEDDSDDELDDDESDVAAGGGRPIPGSTPARTRTVSHARHPQTPLERQSRSVFGPDPDLDLDVETLVERSPRSSGRRDARPRGIEDDPRRNPPSGLPMRSRREARAANRPDSEGLHETSASRDAAEAEAAAREVARAQADDARKRAAREARARDDAAHEAEIRARAEAEKAAREAETRDRLAREKAAREKAAREAEAQDRLAREKAAREKTARETAAREKSLREAADRERAAQQAAAREAAEAAARAKAAREQAEQEKAAREAAEKAAREAAEAAAREAEERAEQERRRAAERARVERERREAEALEQELREAKARAEQARRAAEAREKERRETEAREKAAREKAAREKAEQEKAAREAAEAAAARAEAEAREAAETERRRAAERARVEQERQRADQERRAAEAREKQRREDEAKAEQERREAQAEQARREAAARARAERELLDRQRVEQERLARERREREQREAEAREAEQLRQEARARAEAEARTAAIERARIRAEAEAERARAADRIREEAYARAAEQARRAATGAFPMPGLPPGQTPGRAPSYEPASNDSGVHAPAAAFGQPLQRRAPMYDASREADTGPPEQFRERRSHPRPGSQPRADQPTPVPNPVRSPGAPNGESHYPNGQYATGQYPNGQPANGQDPNGQPANGWYPNGQPGNSQYTHGQPANGGYPNGQPGNGQYPNGQPANGQYPNGQPANGRYPNGQPANGQQTEGEPDSEETTVLRTRREPFGPVTRSQAIIDLSARKRPRSPYSS